MAENTETEKQLKIVVKSASLVFIGLIFSKILTYFFRVIIARPPYGPEDYGMVSIGLSVITVLVTVLIVAMDAGIIRYVSEYEALNDKKRIKGTILTPIKISLPLSIIVTILLWFFSPYLASIFAKDVTTQVDLTTIFQIFSITLPISVCYNFLLAASKGFQRMDYVVYTDNIFFSIVLVMSVVIFSLFSLGVSGIAWSYAITVIVSSLFILYFFNRRIFNLFRKTKAVSDYRKLLGYSLPLFIGSVATIVIGSFDTIFLGIFKNVTDAGLYNAALPTAKLILIFSSAFGALFFQMVIEYKVKKIEKEIPNLYRTTTKWIFFSGFPFVLLLMFFSRNVIIILFGSEYVSAAGALSILSLAFFIQSIFMMAYLILSIDKTKYVMSTLIIAAIMNIILDVILISQFSILGAAVSTSICSIFPVLIDFFLVRKLTKMNPFDFRAISKSVLAGIISISIIVFVYRYSGMVSSTLILTSLFFLFMLVYFILLIALRALDKNDIFVLKEIEKKTGIRISFIRKLIK